MFDATKLIGVKIVLKNGEFSKVAKIENTNSLKELKVILENGKSFVLELSLTKEYIHLENSKLEGELLEAFLENEKQLAAKQKENEKNHKIALENAKKEIENAQNETKHTKTSKGSNHRKDRKNAAFKATYCDGNGDWFKNTCSRECRNINCANNGRVFCRTNSICRKVFEGIKTEADIENAKNTSFVCYESKLLREFRIYAGRDQDGTLRGWSLDKDRIVILTTVKHGCSEEERVIFGAFLIERSYNKDDVEAYATAYENYRIALTPEEAENMLYWEYAPGEGTENLVQWKERLLRYQTDAVCARILADLVDVISKRGDKEETANAEKFFNKYLDLINMKKEQIPEKSGALINK